MQHPENSELADPAQEVLVRDRPSFIQLAAVPVIQDPSTVQDSPWRDE